MTDVKSILAQFQGMDLGALDEVIEAGKRSEREETYKLQVGRTVLRLLPPRAEDVRSGVQKAPWIVRWQHFLMLKGQKDGRSVIDCPRMATPSRPCAACRGATAFAASEALSDQEIADQIRVQKSFLAFALIREQPSGKPPEGVVPLSFGSRVFDGFIGALDEMKRQGGGDALTDLMNGRDVIIRRDDKNMYTVSLAGQPSRAFATSAQMAEVLGAVALAPVHTKVGNLSEQFAKDAFERFVTSAKIQLPTSTRVHVAASRALPGGGSNRSAPAALDAEFTDAGTFGAPADDDF